jgi:protein required for attachment to host cells
MSITWVLVANARSASLYENQGPSKGLTLLKQIEPKDDGLDEDLSIGGMDRSDWHGPDELRRSKAKDFAHHLAGELRRARNDKHYARAVLVAPPTFMGLINAELDTPTARTVSSRVEKDYTRHSPQQLCEQLGNCFCP